MYITRGFSNNVVILIHKGLFSVFQLLYLTFHGSIKVCVGEKVMLGQNEIIYFQCPALVLVPISLLPFLLILQRLLYQITFLMRK